MSGTDELKNMLLTFRVSELQMLLGHVGQNKTGRKTELQSRALELLKNKSVPHLAQVHAKIRELYKSIQQGGSVVSANPLEMHPSASTPPANMVPSSRSLTAPPPGPPPGIHNPGYMPLQETLRQQQQQQQQQQRSNHQPYSMYGAYQPPKLMSGMNHGYPPLPAQPDIRLKRLPFYDQLGELLKPSTLVPSISREPGANFAFFLTHSQASDVALNREVGPGTRNEYTVQIQMRFCLLETSCEQEDHFPPGCMVKVNGKPAQLPNPIPAKQGVEPKRPSRPVNISHLVKLCPQVSNTVTVSWNPDYNRAYVISVNLVRKLSAADLLNRLRTKGARHADFTTGLIKEKLSDSDNEIATTNLKVSLVCPLGKMRMVHPCKSSTCSHLQCFDASIFLNMNEKRPTWTCPVCNKPAIYDNLVIDGYFQEALLSSELGETCTEITLHKDGTWSTSDGRDDICSFAPSKSANITLTDSPLKSDAIEEILDDNDEEDSLMTDSDKGEIKSNNVNGIESNSKDKEILFVDLTSGDESAGEDEGSMDTVEKEKSNSVEGSGGGRNGEKTEVGDGSGLLDPVTTPTAADHPMSDSSSSTSASAPRSPPSMSIINLDSPSPSPPPGSSLYPHPGPTSAIPAICQLRLTSDSRYHPY